MPRALTGYLPYIPSCSSTYIVDHYEDGTNTSQCLLHFHTLPDAFLDLLGLFFIQSRDWTSWKATITELQLNGSFRAGDCRFRQDPVSSAEDFLQLDRLVVLS